MENLFSFRREDYGIQGQWVHGLYIDEIFPEKTRFPHPRKILFLHGAAGSSISCFPLMFLLAQQGYHVIAPNLPGHGKNPKVSMKKLHIWDYIENLRDFCRVFQPDVLMGHSMGSILVQKMALEYPPLKALILLSSIPPFGVAWKIKKPFLRYFFSILYAVPYFLGIPEPLNKAFNKHFIYTQTPSKTTRALFLAYDTDRHAQKETPHLYFDVFRKDFSKIPREKISAPIFICTGEMDPLMPVETEQAIADYYSCPLYAQPQSGHLFIIEEGIQKTSEKIAEFLNPIFSS